jgi:integrase
MRRQRQLTTDDIALAVWDHHSAGLAAADQERAHQPTDADIEAATDKALADARKSGAADLGAIAMLNAMTEVEVLAGKSQWATQRRAVRLARLKADLGSGDTRLIEPAADAFLAKHNFRIKRGGDQYRDLCRKLMRAEIDQLRLTSERDGGDFTGKPADPIIIEPADRPNEFDANADTIMGLFTKYERDNPKEARAETFKQVRRDVQHFADFVGPRVRPGRIEKKHVRDWQDALEQWPVKATEITAFQGLTIREVIRANAALPTPKPTIARQTVRRYMSGLGGYCRWLVRRGYLAVNPMADMLPAKTVTFPRRGLTDAEIGTLFASPLFTGCDGGDWSGVDRPGDVAIRDHRYWIPYVMAYAGARPGEVAQLFVSDVRNDGGIWLMHITELGGEGKRTKTAGSARVVPIHSELIQLGFLESQSEFQ